MSFWNVKYKNFSCAKICNIERLGFKIIHKNLGCAKKKKKRGVQQTMWLAAETTFAMSFERNNSTFTAAALNLIATAVLHNKRNVVWTSFAAPVNYVVTVDFLCLYQFDSWPFSFFPLWYKGLSWASVWM